MSTCCVLPDTRARLQAHRHFSPTWVCTPQIAVRCTFDAGDADAFVGEALRLHDWGGNRALTIVAGGECMHACHMAAGCMGAHGIALAPRLGALAACACTGDLGTSEGWAD